MSVATDVPPTTQVNVADGRRIDGTVTWADTVHQSTTFQHWLTAGSVPCKRRWALLCRPFASLQWLSCHWRVRMS